MLQHSSRRAPPAALVSEMSPGPEDVEIARRLLVAYRATQSTAPQAAVAGDVWTMIAAEQQDFAALLARDDPRELAAYLCNVSRHSASHGIAQGHMEYARIRRDSRYRDFVARMALDKLILLAEAVGAIAPDNPEQGELGRGLRTSPEQLVELIEQRLGLSIAPPAIDGAMLKLHTARGQFGERDLNAIYTAHLLNRLRAARGRDTSVCEIGGGTGRVAYWSRRMGLRSYTIIDLPMVNVVQGFYALKTMPGEEVVLYGEVPSGDACGRLQILPPHAVEALGDKAFDVFLNQDSIPEMDQGIAEGYLGWIARVCRGAFVSINHESKAPYGVDGQAQLSVHEMVDRVDRLMLEARYPYWLRRGYVLEIYAARLAPAS